MFSHLLEELVVFPNENEGRDGLSSTDFTELKNIDVNKDVYPKKSDPNASFKC